jgi:hypothetical protein
MKPYLGDGFAPTSRDMTPVLLTAEFVGDNGMAFAAADEFSLCGSAWCANANRDFCGLVEDMDSI